MKGGGSQTTKLDPQTTQMQREIFDRARAAGNQPYTPYEGQTVAGVSPLASGAAGQYQQLSSLANQGAGALGGDAAARGAFMNPFQQDVIGQLGQAYDRQRNQAALGANDAATQAGAFGGDRHALLVGERQGALDRAQMGDTANLLYGGFNDAMGRAYQAANFGLGAADRAFQAGDYFRNVQQQGLDDQQRRFNEARDWDLRNLDVMKGAMSGMPYGTSTPMQRNIGAGILGGAATGAGLGLGLPGLIGGGILGMF